MSQLQESEENYEARPLWTADDDLFDGSQLMVTTLGPMAKLGTGSVAVGFGNVIKVISAGHEHFDSVPSRLTADNLMNLTKRRRKGVGAARPRLPAM